MSVSFEDVISAYRLLLGREPTEGEANPWLHFDTISELSIAFLASAECQNYMRRRIPALQESRLALDVAPINVEWEADHSTQTRLIRHVTETWTALGESEPHWSVLSSDAFKSDMISQNEDAFYASGASDAALVVAILARHSLSPADFSTVVEYGCGIGRVTPHLATRFRHVVAIDISKSHLDMARAVIAASGYENIRFAIAVDPNFGMTEPFNLWFSRIVLQHNPPPIIALLLQRMFARLSPGGVAIFQVPTYVPGYRFGIVDYLSVPRTKDIEVHCFPQEAVFRIANDSRCVPLEVREDTAMGYPWLSNTFVFRKLR